jgi:hypothetical protein
MNLLSSSIAGLSAVSSGAISASTFARVAAAAMSAPESQSKDNNDSNENSTSTTNESGEVMVGSKTSNPQPLSRRGVLCLRDDMYPTNHQRTPPPIYALSTSDELERLLGYSRDDIAVRTRSVGWRMTILYVMGIIMSFTGNVIPDGLPGWYA